MEDGEISDTTILQDSKLPQPTLDLEAYIKTQEALKKRQAFKKSLACTDASKEIADKISKKNKRSSKRSKKENEVTVNNNKSIISKPDNAGNISEHNLDVIANQDITKHQECENPNDNSGSEYIPSDLGKSSIITKP